MHWGVVQLFVVLLLLLAVREGASQQCSQSYVGYESYNTMTIEYYNTQYTASCGWWGWNRCQRIRMLARSVPVVRTRSVMRTRPVCCAGYGVTYPNCHPICNPSCANGGTCSSPNTCNCLAGWTGQDCSSDVNECTSINPPCGQMCTNTRGSFQCSCMNGYTLNGNACDDIDECSHTPRPCAEICNNTIGSYFCGCHLPTDFVTDNGSCVDIDECADGGGCQHICNNRVGGYFCTCRVGYELVGGTNCTDIDECGLVSNPCGHSCNNSVGSFECSCNSGYVLDSDQRSCSDVDECNTGNGGCDHNCTNSVGNFQCSCQPGYDLADDGFRCIAQPCQPLLAAPQDGGITCDGEQVTTTTCNFSCDPGYSLIGPMERTCQPNNSWTGVNTSCNIMFCDELESSANGFVMLPCSKEYRSVCTVGCNDGYYIDGPTPFVNQTCDVGGSGTVEWTSAPLCRERTPCCPDPCLHGGECTVVEVDSFSCDCTSTSYTGVTCHLGIIMLPSYPVLTMGVPAAVAISALPDTELIISLTASDRSAIIFTTLNVTITNSVSTTMFTIEAVEGTAGGQYYISYSLSGASAGDYTTPSRSAVFVRPNQVDNEINYFMERDLENGDLGDMGCFMAPQSLQCPRGGQQVNLFSTSQWRNADNVVMSQGVLYLVDDSLSLPLAIAGASITTEQNRLLVQRLTSEVPSENTSGCSSFIPSESDLSDLLNYRALANTFLSSTLRLLPAWIQLSATRNGQINTVGDSAYIAQVFTGEQLSSIDGVCQNILTSDNLLHFTIRYDSNFTVRVSGSQVTHTPLDNSLVCLAVELCSQGIPSFHIGLPTNVAALNQLQLITDLASAGWRMSLEGMTFSTMGSLVPVSMMETFWNGFSYQPVSFSGAHIGLRGTFTRELISTATNVTAYLTGDVYWRVDNLNEVLNDALSQRWIGVASGSVVISVTMPFNGSVVDINFTTSLAHLTIGGSDRSVCQGPTDPAGFFITTTQITFTNVNFLEIFPISMMPDNCQLNPYVHMLGNELAGVGFQSSCSDFKLGSLRFSGLVHHFLMIAGLNSGCNYDLFPPVSNPSVLVESFMNNGATMYQLNTFLSLLPSDSGRVLRASLSQDVDTFSAVTELVQVRLLGDTLMARLSINSDSLSFSGEVSLYGMYPSTIEAMASIDQPFDSMNLSLMGNVGSEFVNVFQNSVNDYLQFLVESAGNRIDVFRTGLMRVEQQFNASVDDVDYQTERLAEATVAYEQAVPQLEAANQTYIEALDHVRNVSGEVQGTLESVCELRQCDSVCTSGLQCDNCQFPIKVNSHGFEESSCFLQVTERVPPLETSSYCWSEINSIQKLVFCNCTGFSCSLRSESLSFKELVQEECSLPSFTYESSDISYPCIKIVRGRSYVYNVTQSCCTPSACAMMSPDVECVQSNVACRLVRKQLSDSLSDQVRQSLEVLDDASKALLVSENVVEEKRILRDLQIIAYEQSVATLATVNASRASLNASLQNQMMAGIIPLFRQVEQNNGSTENIIVIRNITFSATTSSPETIIVLPLTIEYSTSVRSSNFFNSSFDFSSIDTSLTQVTQELVAAADRTFIESLQRRRRALMVDPNIVFFQQQCNSWQNARDYVIDIYESLEDAVNSSGSIYTVSDSTDGSTVVTRINITALGILNISINLEDLSNQVLVEDDYTTLVNLSVSVNDSIKSLLQSIKTTTFVNWQSGQEVIHDSSINLAGLTCYGLIDCFASVTDVIQLLITDLPIEFRPLSLQTLEEHTSSFVMLGSAVNITINSALDLATPLYDLLSSNSSVATYWCASPPNITQHPQSSVLTTINSTVTLQCDAESDVPVMYYWSKDRAVVNGMNSNMLTIQVDSVNDEGTYVCHVMNHIGISESAPSTIDVKMIPIITEHPEDKEVYVGSDNGTRVSCNASGDPTPGYQWYFRPDGGSEDVLLVNETSNVLLIEIPETRHSGNYFCRASNIKGAAMSNQAMITVYDVTIPLNYINVAFEIEAVECNDTNTSNDSAVCDNNEFPPVNTASLLVDIENVVNDSFDGPYTIVPAVVGYSDVTDGVVQLSLQIVSANLSSDEAVLQPIRELAEETIMVRNQIRNTTELLRGLITSGQIQFFDGVLTLEPDINSLVVSDIMELCPAGQYLHTSNIICINCPPGSQGVNGSTCLPCSTDTFQNQQGQATCEACPPNQGTMMSSSLQCIDICSPGFYSTTGLSPCTMCPSDTYQSLPRSSECISCPPGTSAPSGSTSNSSCMEMEITVTQGPDRTDDDGGSSAVPIAVGVSIGIITTVAIIVTVIVLLVWYRKRSGRFNVEKNTKPSFEVDNDLYGFMGKTTQPDLVIPNDHPDGNDCRQDQPQEEIKQQRNDVGQNPLYSESTIKAINPLYKSSTGRSDEFSQHESSDNCELIYDNITYSSHDVPVADTEYAYCKH